MDILINYDWSFKGSKQLFKILAVEINDKNFQNKKFDNFLLSNGTTNMENLL